jgi:hypothetical protein
MENVVRQHPEPQTPVVEADGLMVPPWVKFPDIPTTPVGWWRGDQAYRADFREWWDGQTPETQLRLQRRYPEPPDWDGFYWVVQLKTPDLDRETRTVYELMAALLSDAPWRRVREEPGFSILNYLLRSAEEYRPESQEEIAIWAELTGPQHYHAILRYAQQQKGQVNRHYAKMLAVIQESAKRRWQDSCGNAEPHH